MNDEQADKIDAIYDELYGLHLKVNDGDLVIIAEYLVAQGYSKPVGDSAK